MLLQTPSAASIYGVECRSVDGFSRPDSGQLTPKSSRFLQAAQAIQRASHSPPALVEHMRVDHCRAHILVPEQLLNRANVVTIFQQMGRKGMAKSVASDVLGNASRSHRAFTARAIGDSWAWWRRHAPLRGSCEMFAEGNTYCQAHSRSAFGYLRSRANGNSTRPLPACKSASCNRFTRCKCFFNGSWA